VANLRILGGDVIKVAIIGVGNCASALLQGLEYYGAGAGQSRDEGLMHELIGEYAVADIEVVAAFDVAEGKVGVPLRKAHSALPNDTLRFSSVHSDVIVQRGMTHDGIGRYLREVGVRPSVDEAVDVADVLDERDVDVVVNYLPVGSEEATKWYVEQVLAAQCAFVNCIPVFIAREPYWQRRFENRGVPIIGDDVKSQVGATIVHRVLAQLFDERGVKLDRTMQLNVGGNSDFQNMLERDRCESKKISKTNAVTSIAGVEFAPGDIHVGPSDHVPWLTDRKWAYIRLEGRGFGGAPLNVELKLEVWDSPNSAGVVIDAIRLAKVGLDRGLIGPLGAASAYLMKSPPYQMRDDIARAELEEFITG
jgi:myo-inositol-1-phosphate synthase